MNWAVAAPIIVAIVAGLFALLQARRADKSAQFTTTLTAGVSTLVDQLQEERNELKHDVDACRGQCRELQDQVRDLERKVEELQKTIRDMDTEIDNRDAEIIRLRRETGAL